ncbi:MBL fold metallo-hydrolase [Halotalea alkalilenta]|uniref:MBL fold metallo-hydrolase n=1 Tax=Halotalea alkalilenta TaxID=376489 RepID=UPI0009DF30CE|nr:MBL fold metallo-hydrolase [Halotalea alkalilenta]
MSARIEILSGVGGKHPAAILVETAGVRLLLDAGASLCAERPESWWRGLEVDAVVIGHDHVDHIGAVARLDPRIPLYATAQTARSLPPGRDWRALPLRGAVDILGVKVRCGQAGHALGGVWLHLGIGGGILYSGDFSLESALLPFDVPPPASVALLDASYGAYHCALDQAQARIAAAMTGPTLFPVPPSGRALEMALWLQRGWPGEWSMDDACQAALEAALADPQAAELIRPSALAALGRLLERRQGFDPGARLLLAADPDGLGGTMARLLADPRRRHRAIFTGHLDPRGPPGMRTQDLRLRWNVHPRLEDLRWLLERIEAARCVPLFTAIEDEDAWRAALGVSLVLPAQVLGERAATQAPGRLSLAV